MDERREAPEATAGTVPARDPFVRRTATVVAMVAAAGLLLALFLVGIDILLAAFGGLLLAVLLHACSDPVARRTPLPYGGALTVVVLALLGVIALAGWLIAPGLAEQAEELGEQFPRLAREGERTLQQYGWGQWVLERVRDGGMEDGAQGAGAELLSTVSRWSSYTLVTVFVGLFLAANPGLYREGTIALFPLEHRDRLRVVARELGYTLRWWLIGQLATMTLIGISTGLVLWAFGLPLAGTVGLLVGLLGFIPYLGPILGAVPVALLAAAAGPTQLLYVMGAYAGVQLLEGYVANPLIQHRMVYLPPALTITAQLLLGSALGILGFVLATPLAAVALVLSRFYRADVLGDPGADEEQSRGDGEEDGEEEDGGGG
jgi:predicted PurR-regulated permease PerM